jgi:hypothetical protein
VPAVVISTSAYPADFLLMEIRQMKRRGFRDGRHLLLKGLYGRVYLIRYCPEHLALFLDTHSVIRLELTDKLPESVTGSPQIPQDKLSLLEVSSHSGCFHSRTASYRFLIGY